MLQFNSCLSLREYLGTNEISQEGNFNANAKLFIVNENTVAKIYTKPALTAVKNIRNLLKLRKHKDIKGINGIVFPNDLISLDEHIVGYSMDYIHGDQLQIAWNNDRISQFQKYCWINAIADIIKQLPDGINIGDLHSRNVLIDGENSVRIIDVDGFSLADGYVLSSPLAYYKPDSLPSKYFGANGDVIVNRNNDILCFFRLFFKLVTPEIDFYAWPHKYQFSYLEFLAQQGVDNKFINAVKVTLSNGDNYLPPNLIDASTMCNIDFSFRTFLHNSSLIKEEREAESFLNDYIMSLEML